MHITSLPSPYGIGSMGKAAYDFIDFLKEAKQTYWQILPINPPGYGDSPYQAFSTFAGNPYLIDLDELVKAGYLAQEELDRVDWGSRADQVDFSKMYDQRLGVLHLAWSRFHKAPTEDYAEYVREQSAWLDEYVLFMAVKAYYNDGPWTEWPLDIRMHQPEAMAYYRELLHDELDFHRFLQFCFHTQWQRLREYAHENGVQIIGDIPIYVPLDSADVWSHPENFQLTRTRRPRVVAGCPPDGFNANGQYWGNPIYDWTHMEQDGFSWWMRRLRAAGESFDVVRIDHFRGIESYWAIPAVNRTARKGKWIKGPGRKLVNAIRKNCPDTDFIAEDLGFLTPEVQQLVTDSGFPGRRCWSLLSIRVSRAITCPTATVKTPSATPARTTMRRSSSGARGLTRRPTPMPAAILALPRRMILQTLSSRPACSPRRSCLSCRCRTICGLEKNPA